MPYWAVVARHDLFTSKPWAKLPKHSKQLTGNRIEGGYSANRGQGAVRSSSKWDAPNNTLPVYESTIL
jgi:hypothetical protein